MERNKIINGELFNSKRNLLAEIDKFYLLPYFDVPNATEYLHLVNRFYEISEEVIKTFNIPQENFKYIVDNFCLDRNPKTTDELISALNSEKKAPERNDSRYLLGFRSTSFILNENIDSVSITYLKHIISLLKPFEDLHIPNKELN